MTLVVIEMMRVPGYDGPMPVCSDCGGRLDRAVLHWPNRPSYRDAVFECVHCGAVLIAVTQAEALWIEEIARKQMRR